MDHKHLSQSRGSEHDAVRTRLQRLARLLDDALRNRGSRVAMVSVDLHNGAFVKEWSMALIML